MLSSSQLGGEQEKDREDTEKEIYILLHRRTVLIISVQYVFIIYLFKQGLFRISKEHMWKLCISVWITPLQFMTFS
jgi:hypothetical protein